MRGILYALALAFWLLTGAARADVDYVRELAKQRTKIVIATEGAAGKKLGEALVLALRRHPDWGRRKESDVALLTFDEAERRLSESREKPTLIFLLEGKERTDLPPNLSLLLPFDSKLLGGRRSVLVSVADSQKPGSEVFRIALYAPDGERLKRLFDPFLARRVGNFRELPFALAFDTNRLALFSAPELKGELEGWGRRSGGVWNDILWLPLGTPLTPEQAAERTKVFFTDRLTTPIESLPADAALALGETIVHPTTALVARNESSAAEPSVLLSLPSRRLLLSYIERYKTLEALSSAPPTRELADLSRVSSAPLLIVGKSAPPVAEALHISLSQAMRDRLGLNVEPRGAVLAALEGEIAQQLAQGATDSRGVLARKAPSRYVWVFTLVELAGRTEYRSDERRLTTSPGAFAQAEPERPRRRRDEDEDEYEERYARWRRDWERWLRARRDWEDEYENAPVDWELTLSAECSVQARGQLALIDTKTPGGPQILWSALCRHDARDSQPRQRRRVTLRGHAARPRALETPPAEADAPAELVRAALNRAAQDALTILRDEAILPEATPTASSREGVGRYAGKVAEVSAKVVTLNIGARQGVKIGDRFEALVRYSETRDPDTGRVIRVRVQESVLLEITHVDEEACDATPVHAADASKLAALKVGAPVRRPTGD